MPPNRPETLTPLSAAILFALADGASHGYAIIKDVEQMSEGRVVLSTGTLYGALQRLLTNGWIEEHEEEESSRDRRAYRLTARGRRNLQQEVDRLKHLTRLAGARIARKEA